MGDDAVVYASPRDAHLPEARFAWAPMTALPEAKPRPVDEPRLIRRLYTTPVPLPPRERHEPDGWLLRGLAQGPVVKVNGPYAVSGWWWKQPIEREYHFAETKTGQNLWVFYDRGKSRWFLQGQVEGVMSNLLWGVVAGVVFGSVAVGLMLPLSFPTSRRRCSGRSQTALPSAW
mgnify:CR=1 FL=1